jgi:hypothetical protein
MAVAAWSTVCQKLEALAGQKSKVAEIDACSLDAALETANTKCRQLPSTGQRAVLTDLVIAHKVRAASAVGLV